jgi:hypothetical protein
VVDHTNESLCLHKLNALSCSASSNVGHGFFSRNPTPRGDFVGLRLSIDRSDDHRRCLAAVLDAATDDTLLAIAVALPTAADLLRLALTCRAAAQRFYFAATSHGSSATVLT